MDLFAMFDISTRDVRIPIETVLKRIEYYQEILREREKKGEAKLSEAVRDEAMVCFKDGIRNIGVYHNSKVIKLMGKKHVGTDDLRLLYYYHNKMAHYELPVQKLSIEELLNKQYQ